MNPVAPPTALQAEKPEVFEGLDVSQNPEPGQIDVLAERVDEPDLEQAACLEAIKVRAAAAAKTKKRTFEGRLYLQASALYSPDLADIILTRIAAGETVTSICKPRAMPSAATVMGWAMRNLHGFGDRFWQAKRLGAHILVDEAKDIANDDADDIVTLNTPDGVKDALNTVKVARDKLRIATRQWTAEKLLPEVYAPVADKKPENAAITVQIMSFQPPPADKPPLAGSVTIDVKPTTEEPKT